MYHSLIFKNDIKNVGLYNGNATGMSHNGYIITEEKETINTWDDWHLIPSKRPQFTMPKQKTNYLEVPGASYSLDLSESLTGYPVYEDREGSFEFIMENGYGQWYNRYSEIAAFLHGQTLRVFLEDDPEYFYEGRFAIDSYAAGDSRSNPRGKIVISYRVNPYKWYHQSSIEPWLWDPFNFETGVIYRALFADIQITTTQQSRTFDKYIGNIPFCPNFVVKTSGGQGATLRLVNKTIGFDRTQDVGEGTTRLPNFIFYGPVTLYFKAKSGSGTMSIEFYPGRL